MKAKFVTTTGLMGLLCVGGGSLRAGAVYTYTGLAPTSFIITLDTTLTGAALDNLAPGTDITPDVNSLTITGPDTPYSQDLGGFPLGGDLGSGYLTEAPTTIEIGTNATGLIDSWDIAFSIFASYPAFEGENPSDFFCTYAAAATTGGDSVTLTQDSDAGFCPGDASALASYTNWSAPGVSGPTAPEPQSYMLLATELLGLLAFGRRSRARLAKSSVP